MNNPQIDQDVRLYLIAKILHSLEYKSFKENVVELSETLSQKPEVEKDLPLVESITLLDFIAKQILNGNSDIITQELVQESYIYILDKLIPSLKPVYSLY